LPAMLSDGMAGCKFHIRDAIPRPVPWLSVIT
jgi:hypothetical protein